MDMEQHLSSHPELQPFSEYGLSAIMKAIFPEHPPEKQQTLIDQELKKMIKFSGDDDHALYCTKFWLVNHFDPSPVLTASEQSSAHKQQKKIAIVANSVGASVRGLKRRSPLHPIASSKRSFEAPDKPQAPNKKPRTLLIATTIAPQNEWYIHADPELLLLDSRLHKLEESILKKQRIAAERRVCAVVRRPDGITEEQNTLRRKTENEDTKNLIKKWVEACQNMLEELLIHASSSSLPREGDSNTPAVASMEELLHVLAVDPDVVEFDVNVKSFKYS